MRSGKDPAKFAFLVYDTHVDHCLYYREWVSVPGAASKEDCERLLFGLVYSLRRTADRLSPAGKQARFSAYTTSGYKLHYWQSLSGVIFVILTQPNVPTMRERLKLFYSQVYLPDVAMNPLYEPGKPIMIPAFDRDLDAFDFEKR